jgi:hypothetical protein
MTRLHQFSLIGLLLAVSLQQHVEKKQRQQFYLKPDQTADLPADTKMVTSKERCENWALAAGLEMLLERQSVPLKQNFWVMRWNGGELCVDRIPPMEAVAQAVNKEFVLEDGRHVRLELQYSPGPPADVDALIAGLKLRQVSLLLWRGHPYYLTGVTYDERIGRDGTRFFEIKEMRLADTYPKEPAATFQKGRDNPDEIGGSLSVAVAAQ